MEPDFTKPDCVRRPRPRPARTIGKPLANALKARLLAERERIVNENLAYRMLGKELVISSQCIDKLCKRARYVTCIDDVCVPGLREQFVRVFYSVMMDTLK